MLCNILLLFNGRITRGKKIWPIWNLAPATEEGRRGEIPPATADVSASARKRSSRETGEARDGTSRASLCVG